MKPSSRAPRTPSKLSDLLHHQLNMYALAASAAGVGALALAQPAEAKIVYTPAHVVLGYGGVKSYQLDLNHDRKSDFILRYLASSTCSGAGWYLFLMPAAGNGALAYVGGHYAKRWLDSALKPGSRVGGEERFSAAKAGLVEEVDGIDGDFKYGAWFNVKNRYLGLKFRIHGKIHYGWARMNVKLWPDSGLFTATLTGYAYETIPNKPIITGKIEGPDVITVQLDTAPGSLGRLAQGRK